MKISISSANAPATGRRRRGGARPARPTGALRREPPWPRARCGTPARLGLDPLKSVEDDGPVSSLDVEEGQGDAIGEAGSRPHKADGPPEPARKRGQPRGRRAHRVGPTRRRDLTRVRLGGEDQDGIDGTGSTPGFTNEVYLRPSPPRRARNGERPPPWARG